jgi:hypothetical protein
LAGKLFTLEAEDEACRGFENHEAYMSRTMNVTGMKICEGKCKKPFKPIFEGQTVCTQCAIAPRRKTFDPISEKIQENSTPIKEANMPIEKICVEPDCQKPFTGKGKRCAACQKKWKDKYNAEYNAKNRTPLKQGKKSGKMIELKKVNNAGEEIGPMINQYPPTMIIRRCKDQTTAELFDAASKLCEMTGSVTIQAAGMEITFKKV